MQTTVDRGLSRVYGAHRGLNVIVSGDILQRNGVRVLSGLGQKVDAQPAGFFIEQSSSVPVVAVYIERGKDCGLRFSTFRSKVTI